MRNAAYGNTFYIRRAYSVEKMAEAKICPGKICQNSDDYCYRQPSGASDCSYSVQRDYYFSYFGVGDCGPRHERRDDSGDSSDV